MRLLYLLFTFPFESTFLIPKAGHTQWTRLTRAVCSHTLNIQLHWCAPQLCARFRLKLWSKTIHQLSSLVEIVPLWVDDEWNSNNFLCTDIPSCWKLDSQEMIDHPSFCSWGLIQDVISNFSFPAYGEELCRTGRKLVKKVWTDVVML